MRTNMRNVFFGTATLLAILSGCSQNELLDGQNGIQNDGKVRFAASTNRTISRAETGNPITNAGDLQTVVGEFTVSGYVGSEATALINAAEVNWTGASWEYSNEPYWPSATINFFAYANWSGTAPAIASTGITATGVTVAEDNLTTGGQKDLLVAASKGATKETRTTLTFKHALTQVVFKAGNLDDQKLQVRIGGMRIVNVSNKGDIAVDTEAKITWENNSSSTDTQRSKYHVQGLQVGADATFATTTAATDAYTVGDVTATTTYADYKQVQLTTTTATGDNALLLVPQTFDAWNPNDTETSNPVKPATTKKAYIELLAIINHPDKASTDAAVGNSAYYYCGTPVQGADGKADTYGKIYIPIESKAGDMNEWTPGKRISYIITFGDTGSGSGGGGYDEDNNPILVPIKFTAKVEDWVDVDVPLLTASFSASSTDIKAEFIDGFTNNLLKDIAAAKEVKAYRANIKISGTLKAAATIAFSDAQNAKIATGSTVTYDFTGITEWNSVAITMTVPAGWKAQAYKVDAAGAEVVAGSDISIEGSTANKFILTRIVDTPVP